MQISPGSKLDGHARYVNTRQNVALLPLEDCT